MNGNGNEVPPLSIRTIDLHRINRIGVLQLFRILCKVFCIVLFCVGFAVLNTWLFDGPVLKQNTTAAVQQFDGMPATASGICIGKIWIHTSVIYVLEYCLIGLITYLFVRGEIERLNQYIEDKNRG